MIGPRSGSMLREAVSVLGPPAGIRVWLACARTDMRNVRTEHAPAVR